MISRSAPQTPHRPGPVGTDATRPAGAAPDGLQGLGGLHVLVVGADDELDGIGGTWGARAIADHLSTSAQAVTVLTGVPHRADGRTFEAYRRGLRTVEPGWLRSEGPQVVRLRRYNPQRSGGGRATLRELTFLTNAVAAGRRLRADLVIGLSPCPGGAAAAAWLAARKGAPLVTVVQSPTIRHAGMTARVSPALERYALRRSAQVAVASETFLRPLLAAGVGPERMHLLPAWSPLAPAGLSRAAARYELGWDPDRFVAVHAGPLGHQQDGATLVETARLLDGLGGDDGRPGEPARPEVILLGEGSQRAALEQQGFGVTTVRFLDPVEDQALPLVLAAADVLLVAEPPSATAWPAERQLAGYLGAGRPVLAAARADGATACELRRSGGAGLRVDPGDPVALARTLLELRDAAPRRAAMGRAGLRYARAQLGREASLRRLDAVIEAALGVPPESAPDGDAPPPAVPGARRAPGLEAMPDPDATRGSR